MNILFVGTDNNAKKRKLEEICSKNLDPATRELNLNLFYGDTDSTASILTNLNTPPFSSSKRITYLKNIQSLPKKEKETLLNNLKKISKHSIFIIDLEHYQAKDSFIKSVSSCCHVTHFDPPKTLPAVKNWIIKYLSKENREISKDAISYLIKIIQMRDISNLSSELDKICLYIDDKKRIDVTDVASVVCGISEADIFEITNAIKAKDRKKAMFVLSVLLNNKAKPYEILGFLGWHFRKAYAGLKTSDITGREDLSEKIRFLLELDYKLKTSRAKPSILLEASIVKLCG